MRAMACVIESSVGSRPHEDVVMLPENGTDMDAGMLLTVPPEGRRANSREWPAERQARQSRKGPFHCEPARSGGPVCGRSVFERRIGGF
jgi:hypothetical protein